MVVRVSLGQLPKLKDGYRIERPDSINRGARRRLEQDDDTFIELYNLGYTYAEIMSVLNVKSFNTIQKWRKRLRLSRRPSGNYSSHRRKERGK